MIAQDPVDGFGVGCSTAAEVAAGEALLLLAAPPGAKYPSIGVAITPDGAAAPAVEDAAGKETKLGRAGNLSATVVPTGGKVSTFGKRWDLASIQDGIGRSEPRP